MDIIVRNSGQACLRILFFILLLCFEPQAIAQPQIDCVRVVKSERTLMLLAEGKVVRQFNIVLGSNPKGPKRQEGDGKTPEGIYTLDYKKSDSAFYKAIHISYPNAADIASARQRGVSPGGQIMIHGQKNGLGWLSFISQRFDWTNGCIALSNGEMDEVWRLVNEGTKIEILP